MNAQVSGLKVAMVQMAIANEPMVNAAAFLAEPKNAAAKGADIVVGPEMMLTHYVSGDRYEDDAFIDEMWQAAMYIVSESASIGAVLIFGGIGLDPHPGIVGEDGRRRKYNAAFIAQDGELVDTGWSRFAIKTLQPNYRIFDDSRHFYDARKLAEEQNWYIGDFLQPFPVTIREKEYQLGVMICEDMWDGDYGIEPARMLQQNGADILINLSASPWSWQKNRKRDQIVAEICRKTGLPFVYVNNVGVQNNGKNFITFDGASTAYNAAGEIISLAKRYQEETLVVDVFEGGLAPQVRPTQPDVAELYEAIEVATRGFLDTIPESAKRKVVIGVSGGMDSALSVAFFAKVMGPERVIAINLPYGNFNSRETKDDAAELCRRAGVEYRVVPIDAIVDATATAAGILPGTAQHKTTQAIARMAVLAGVAGQENGFFTSNANWTEITFGYGTLNGDLRGTFSPWMNVLKQDVYRMAEYLNRAVYGREVIPQSIFDRPPMDELTAPGAGERGDPFDYGDLKENGYHDQMVRAVVAFRRSAEWFVEQYLAGTLEAELRLSPGRLAKLFPSMDAQLANAETWLADLERCFNLFHNQTFKRVQSVPGPLVDKRSFGWDFRESVLPWVKTVRYNKLKESLLVRHEWWLERSFNPRP